ncbi:unnamed protein product, partial [marine sediment metagenome]
HDGNQGLTKIRARGIELFRVQNNGVFINLAQNTAGDLIVYGETTAAWARFDVSAENLDFAAATSIRTLAGALTLSPTANIIQDAGVFVLTASIDSGAVADQVSIGRYEIGGGNTVFAISQETAVAVDVDETKFSHKMQVRLNGATYFIMLTQT